MSRLMSNTAVLTVTAWIALGYGRVAEAQGQVIAPAVDKPLKLVDFAKGGTAPLVGFIQGVSKDGRHLEFVQMSFPPSAVEKRLVEIDEDSVVDGKAVTKTVKKERTVIVTVGKARASTTRIPLDEIRAYDSRGARIPAPKISALFAHPRVICFEYEGMSVDPKLLEAMRPDTPFLVLPLNMIAAPAIPAADEAPAVPVPEKPK